MRPSPRATPSASSASCTASGCPRPARRAHRRRGDRADVEFGGWGGIYTQADVSDEVRDTLEAAVAEAVESERYQEFQDNAGNLVVYKDSAEFTDFVNEQFAAFQTLLGS